MLCRLQRETRRAARQKKVTWNLDNDGNQEGMINVQAWLKTAWNAIGRKITDQSRWDGKNFDITSEQRTCETTNNLYQCQSMSSKAKRNVTAHTYKITISFECIIAMRLFSCIYEYRKTCLPWIRLQIKEIALVGHVDDKREERRMELGGTDRR